MKGKERIDKLLVQKGFFSSRTRAQAVIMAGDVFVDGERVDKAGTFIAPDSDIQVRQSPLKYVGRGGLKLEEAIREFDLEIKGKVVLDIGASTGGFTDCLLQYGAKKVFALDVGYGQLDWNLRQDERVVVKERINARYLKPDDIGEPIDICVIDVSFISLTKIIPPATRILKPKGVLVALIKPQFEVGKGEVGKGGIVRDEEKHERVVEEIKVFIGELSYEVLGVIPSPILGGEGNKEFLVAAIKQ